MIERRVRARNLDRSSRSHGPDRETSKTFDMEKKWTRKSDRLICQGIDRKGKSPKANHAQFYTLVASTSFGAEGGRGISSASDSLPDELALSESAEGES